MSDDKKMISEKAILAAQELEAAAKHLHIVAKYFNDGEVPRGCGSIPKPKGTGEQHAPVGSFYINELQFSYEI